jgi:hypothetical protein
MSSERCNRKTNQPHGVPPNSSQRPPARPLRALRWRDPAMILAILVALMSNGCAHLNADPSPPRSRFAAAAQSIFRYPNQPTTQAAAPAETAKGDGAVPGQPNASTGTNSPATNLGQLSPPVADELNPAPNSTVSFRDEQIAYAQGRHDAMQAGYQQPVSGTNANPMDPSPSNFPPQDQPQYYAPDNRNTMPQQQVVQGQVQQNYYGHQVEQQPYAYPPEYVNPPMVTAYQGQPAPQYTQQQSPYPSPAMQTGTGYLAGGLNMVGTQLRLDFDTATEIAYELRVENESLRNQLNASHARIEELLQQIQEKQVTLSSTKELLTNSNRLAAQLRERIASQTVKLQDLEKEKQTIERNADKALKEIETNLDEILIDTISKRK